MLAQQRHTEIQERLRLDGAVRVAELARTFGVTEETVRRDLEKLDKAGKLVRTHGGALPTRDVSQDVPFDIRQTAKLAEKQAIARHAVRYVGEGAAIALDASSTVHELARVLPDQRLTVITNSLPATLLLARCEQLQVLSTGGILDPGSVSWTGSLAEHALDRININRCFLSTHGVHVDRGLSEVDDYQARVKHRMMDAAEEVYLLVDHSKFGMRRMVPLAGLDEIDVLITDRGADPQVLAQFADRGVRVEVAE